MRGARGTSRTATSHLPPAATHLSHPPARGGHGPRGRPGPGRSRLDRVDPDLPAPHQRLAGRRVPPCLASSSTPGMPPSCWPWRPSTHEGHRRTPSKSLDPRTESDREWAVLAAELPAAGRHHAAATSRSSTRSSPHEASSWPTHTLRQFARWLVAETDVTDVAGITRTHIEDYKVWLATQPGTSGRPWPRTPNGIGCG